MNKVNIRDQLKLINNYWNPIIVGELNGQMVKLVKIKGEFVMHHHEKEDEMFLVLDGEFQMDYGDRLETIKKGEFVIVPRGIDHRPIAREEAHILLFEPATVLNTGNIRNEMTVDNPKKL